MNVRFFAGLTIFLFFSFMGATFADEVPPTQGPEQKASERPANPSQNDGDLKLGFPDRSVSLGVYFGYKFDPKTQYISTIVGKTSTIDQTDKAGLSYGVNLSYDMAASR